MFIAYTSLAVDFTANKFNLYEIKIYMKILNVNILVEVKEYF